MLNQKQKLQLIQVPGTDMVATTATHTDTVVTTAVDTTMVRLRNYLINCNTIARYPTLPYLNFKQYFKTYQSNVLIQQFKL